MQALIISGGHLEDAFATSFIQQNTYDLTIAADSGMKFFYQKGWIPDYIVGDFDSVTSEILQKFLDITKRKEIKQKESSGLKKPNSTQQKESSGLENIEEKISGTESKQPIILQFQPEKDETDTEIAIRTAIKQGCKTIHILGATTGNRIDHLLGNIHLLGIAMEHGVECLMLDAYNRIRMINKGIVIKKEEQYGKYVSLLPFTSKVTGLTLTGFKYPLDCYTMECYHSLGVSNEITESQAMISFQDGVLLVIESRD
ncbi:MAG: thiamine diphosphokinase [Lachnospiraceae bacterium]